MGSKKGLPLEEILSFFSGSDSKHLHLRRGERLCKEGEQGELMYVVVRGRLRASREQSGVIGDIGPGEPVGDLALLGDHRRTATITATRDSELIELPPEALSQLPADGLRWILSILGDRLRSLHRPRGGARTILIWGSDQKEDVERASAVLSEAIRKTDARAVSLNSSDLPGDLSSDCEEDEERSHKIGRWISQKEDQCELAVLSANSQVDPVWTRACLRHADRILVVCDSQRLQEDQHDWVLPSLPKDITPDCRPEIDLVVVHSQDPPFPPLVDLLGQDQIDQVNRVYHVRRHQLGDLDRLARHQAGQARALVLSGGGARGIAHIGCLRALESRGIEVDAIGGTSIGSFVGGLASSGMPHRQILEYMRENFAKGGIRRYQVPLVSVDSGKGYIGVIEKAYGDLRIEDFPIPFYAVSCNLSTGSPGVHRSGRAATWVGASMSVPALAPPLIRNGEVFVDGGVLNNLPIDIARSGGARHVFAVDVGLAPSLDSSLTFDGWPTSVDAIRSWLQKDTTNLPGLPHLMSRIMTLSSIYQQEQLKRSADMLVSIPSRGCGLLDWKRIDELEALGYETMNESLDQWEKESDDEN